jgi:hypothetical protein
MKVTMIEQKSFAAHNKQYETDSNLEWHFQEYKKFDTAAFIKSAGFLDLFSEVSKRIRIHIDVGSGAGFLVMRSAKFFDKSIGVEPSLAATNIALQFPNDLGNIEYINMFMTEWVAQAKFTSPVFVTTSAVLSHIEDPHVQCFLNLLCERLPDGSELYFYEPYDKNIQTSLWHVRSRYWWMRNMPHCTLKFLSIRDSGYDKGIYAIKDAKKYNASNLTLNKPAVYETIIWNLSGVMYKLRFMLLKLIRRCGIL